MDVLQPLIDDGTLVVKSGQTDIEQAATLRWDGETAQSRMEDILTANYSDGTQVDAVLSPYDGISRGIISALTDAGYSVGEEWPIISGQDAEVDSVKAILSGEQYATIFKDTRELAKVAADMAIDILNGDEVEVNDEETYDNGVKVVPSYLLGPVPVVKDNVESALVDTGYWTAGRARPLSTVRLHRAEPRRRRRGARTPASVAAVRSPCQPARGSRNVTEQHPGDARHHQDVSRREGTLERQLRSRARRGPRHLRRERRRQVHPHEGAVRRVPARHVRGRHRLCGR